MTNRLRRGTLTGLVVSALLSLTAAVAGATPVNAAPAGSTPTGDAPAAALTEVTNFGNNPGNLRMFEYVPAAVKPNPAILVAAHYCTGTAQAFFSGTEFRSLADRYGFIVIYPDANVSGQCFDVASSGALRHDGTSDPASVVSMVGYVKQHNASDGSRVFVTGASSGGMFTEVLLGDYPDVFKAGADFMGVPFACFATSDPSGWNNQCAQGQITHTAQEWGSMVRGAYPGYSGARPRVQLWHGTNDTTLSYHNFGEAIKQWTNVLGLSQTPVSTVLSGNDTRTRYGSDTTQAQVEAHSIAGVGHSLPLSGEPAQAIAFFGLNS